jgi:hypothetical protein
MPSRPAALMTDRLSTSWIIFRLLIFCLGGRVCAVCWLVVLVRSKEKDFWEFGQRAALTLPKVGFATTTDVDKSALHPPDKQDIAPRMANEILR